MQLVSMNISLPQGLVLELLKEAEHQKVNISELITQVMGDSLGNNVYQRQQELLSIAIHKAANHKEGETFTLKSLLSEEWGDIESPRAFGRKFKQGMIELGLAKVTGKQSDNKLIYTRTEKVNKEVQDGGYFAIHDVYANGHQW